MVDLNIIAAKLRELDHRAQRVREFCPATAAELAQDDDVLELLSFNLMLAVQACLDVASHMIADEEWGPTETLGSSFRRLYEKDVLSEDLAARLSKAVGLRNLLAHNYTDVQADLLHAAVAQGLPDFGQFASEISRWVQPEEP